jgi:type II secretory pathway pseudopilin PulG
MMVVAIIGIMSAIAIGAYTKNIRKARQTQVVANLSKLTLREAAVYSLRGHYASTTPVDDLGALYPAQFMFNTTCDWPGAGGNTCDTPRWDTSHSGYTAQSFSGPYFTLGAAEHGFDILSFMPDGGKSRCAYGVISGYGSNGSLPNGQPVSETPPANGLSGEVWANAAPSLVASDWFVAFARCDFDRDGGNWGDGKMWDFTITNLDAKVNMGDGVNF